MGLHWDSLWQNLVDGCTTPPQRYFLFGVCVLLSFFMAYLCNLFFRKAIAAVTNAKTRYKTGISGSLKYPLFWCFFLTGFYHSFKVFQLSAATENTFYRGYVTLLILLILRGLLNVVNFLCNAYRSSTNKNVYSNLLIDLVGPAVKAIIWIAGILFFLENVCRFHIGTLLAGAGIASMAVAFAAQNTIANVFGAITLILDKPFLPGEEIQVNGQTGIVQSIGLRSVRMTALDGTVWTIPNKTMSESSIVNLSRRPYTRYTFVLNLTYAHAPEQLQRGKELLSELLAAQPLVDMNEHPPRISFDNIGASSLDLQAVCWFRTSNTGEFTKAKDKINFQILEKFTQNGFDFAFPSQSIYIEKMDTGSPDRSA